MGHSLARLVGVVALGVLLLGGVIGSAWLAQADVLIMAPSSTGGLILPTPTLYPEDPPRKPVLSYPTSTAVTTPALGEATATPVEGSDGICDKIPAGWVYYTVNPGDTFAGLAARGGTTLAALLEGNCKAQAYPLQAGETLYLPEMALTMPTVTPFVCGRPPGWQTIRVQPGDTFSALAYRYGVELSLLLGVNCRTPAQTDLYAGETIHVPPRVVVAPTLRPTFLLPTVIPTETPSATPSPTATALPSATPTETPWPSPTPTPTETPVTVPTWTMTPPDWELPTVGPPVTETPDLTPPPEGTPTASPEPSATPMETPTETLSPSATPPPTTGAPTPTETPPPPATGTSASPAPTTAVTVTPSPLP